MNNTYIILRNFIKSLGILLVSAFVIYFIGGAISKLYFLAFLFLAWRSKNDYFWTAIVFVMISLPSGLFAPANRIDPQGLPLYTFGPIGFSFIQLFSLMMLFKAILNRKFTFLFKKQYFIGLLFFLFLIIVSVLIGVDLNGLRKIYMIALALSLYYSFLFIFREEKYVVSFFELIFPYVFVALMLQIYGLINEERLITLIRPDLIGAGIWNSEMAEFKRPIEMTELLILSVFGGLYFFVSNRFSFNKLFLVILIGTSAVSIFLTGTRSWFVGYVVLILLYFIINTREMTRSAQYIGLGIILLIALISFSSTVATQMENALSRIATLGGAVSREEGLVRIDERLPRVLEGISQSTIIVGAGFSDIYTKYNDAHVGFVNMFLVSGVVGYLFYIYFYTSIYIRSLNLVGNTKNLIATREVKNICISMIPILLITTATQFFGFSMTGYPRVFVLAFILAWLNATVSNALKTNKFSTLVG